MRRNFVLLLAVVLCMPLAAQTCEEQWVFNFPEAGQEGYSLRLAADSLQLAGNVRPGYEDVVRQAGENRVFADAYLGKIYSRFVMYHDSCTGAIRVESEGSTQTCDPEAQDSWSLVYQHRGGKLELQKLVEEGTLRAEEVQVLSDGQQSGKLLKSKAGFRLFRNSCNGAIVMQPLVQTQTIEQESPRQSVGQQVAFIGSSVAGTMLMFSGSKTGYILAPVVGMAVPMLYRPIAGLIKKVLPHRSGKNKINWSSTHTAASMTNDEAFIASQQEKWY